MGKVFKLLKKLKTLEVDINHNLIIEYVYFARSLMNMPNLETLRLYTSEDHRSS
jgi:hypothetical protein